MIHESITLTGSDHRDSRPNARHATAPPHATPSRGARGTTAAPGTPELLLRRALRFHPDADPEGISRPRSRLRRRIAPGVLGAGLRSWRRYFSDQGERGALGIPPTS